LRWAAQPGSDLNQFGKLVDAFLVERARKDAIEALEESFGRALAA
jgi:hypothetical protein